MTFDPYHKWLGIPPEDQPPSYYRLLGLKEFETDPDVIASAADRQKAHVRTFQTGQHSAESQRLLNEVSTARVTLLNAQKKANYDAMLKQQLEPPAAQPQAVLPSPLFDPAHVAPMPVTRKPWWQTYRTELTFGSAAAIVLLAVLTFMFRQSGDSSQDRQEPQPTRVAALTPPKQPDVATPLPEVVTPPKAGEATAPPKTNGHIANSIGMGLMLIPAGEFQMGSTEEEIDRVLRESDDPTYVDRVRSEAPRHRVRITQPFYMGVCEVTQGEYLYVMGKNPSQFQELRAPVEMVSGDDAKEFCRRLSERPAEKAAGRVYRLPTEAEWEYACRAGTTTRYNLGDDPAKLAEYAWVLENAAGRTHPVGQKKPNAWGLFDMHGNVWERCGDWYHNKYYEQSPLNDPKGPAAGSLIDPDKPGSGTCLVLRGGSWASPNLDWFRCAARATSRSGSPPASQFGFRVVCPLSSPASQPVDPNRAAAEVVFRCEGEIKLHGDNRAYRSMDELPAGEFAIAGILLKKDHLAKGDIQTLCNMEHPERVIDFNSWWGASIHDEEAKSLARFSQARYLFICGSQISDAGLLYLVDHISTLESVGLPISKVTDAAIHHLSRLKIRTGHFSECSITDSCLESLKGITTLKEFFAVRTKITPEGVRRFNAVRPDVKIRLEEPAKDAAKEEVRVPTEAKPVPSVDVRLRQH